MNSPAVQPAGRAGPGDYWRALRPRQWTKNLAVLAAFFFAFGDRRQAMGAADFWTALLALVMFAAVSSGVYVFNDILDRERDRRHPVKCRRPVASGRLAPAQAGIFSVLLLALGLGGAAWLHPPLGLVLASYMILQLAYTLRLKQVALVDVFVIAAGFVLRVIAGAVAVACPISPWLLVCAFLLALFLALCKRRHEKRLAAETGRADFRPSLEASDERLLDQLIAVTAGAVIVAYAVYTQWPDTVDKFGTHRLGLTIPFVVFGLFRYLDLVYRQARGDQPEAILLTDPPLLTAIALFGLSVLGVILL